MLDQRIQLPPVDLPGLAGGEVHLGEERSCPPAPHPPPASYEIPVVSVTDCPLSPAAWAKSVRRGTGGRMLFRGVRHMAAKVSTSFSWRLSTVASPRPARWPSSWAAVDRCRVEVVGRLAASTTSGCAARAEKAPALAARGPLVAA